MKCSYDQLSLNQSKWTHLLHFFHICPPTALIFTLLSVDCFEISVLVEFALLFKIKLIFFKKNHRLTQEKKLSVLCFEWFCLLQNLVMKNSRWSSMLYMLYQAGLCSMCGKAHSLYLFHNEHKHITEQVNINIAEKDNFKEIYLFVHY